MVGSRTCGASGVLMMHHVKATSADPITVPCYHTVALCRNDGPKRHACGAGVLDTMRMIGKRCGCTGSRSREAMSALNNGFFSHTVRHSWRCAGVRRAAATTDRQKSGVGVPYLNSTCSGTSQMAFPARFHAFAEPERDAVKSKAAAAHM